MGKMSSGRVGAIEQALALKETENTMRKACPKYGLDDCCEMSRKLAERAMNNRALGDALMEAKRRGVKVDVSEYGDEKICVGRVTVSIQHPDEQIIRFLLGESGDA